MDEAMPTSGISRVNDSFYFSKDLTGEMRKKITFGLFGPFHWRLDFVSERQTG